MKVGLLEIKLKNQTKVTIVYIQLESANGSTSNNKLYLANTPSLGIMLMTSYVLDAKTAIENDQVFIHFCN
jgi:hypothetical protein